MIFYRIKRNKRPALASVLTAVVTGPWELRKWNFVRRQITNVLKYINDNKHGNSAELWLHVAPI